jgi:uncharacterized membrane protein YhaH (DUF805 family)
MAFAISGIFACALVEVLEDIFYSATDVPSWNTWRFHPVSIFVGTLAFLGLLYILQRMNDPAHALQYLEPYIPLVGFSGVNLALKLNATWLLPVALFSVAWSVVQVRRLRDRKPLIPRISLLK